MNYKNILFFFILVSAIIGSTSCKTDFEINAPYDDIPVIFATLDQTVDTQYVKINKTYLGGTGNNADFAAINDSVLFSNLSATVDEVTNGAVTNSYNLSEIWVKGIDPGLFNTDSQKIYYFVPNGGLDATATYNLTVNIDEGRKQATASTGLVEDFQFSNLFKQQLFTGVGLINGNGEYRDLLVGWQTAKGASVYESGLIFYYDEHSQNGIVEKNIRWSFGKSTATNTDGGQDLTKDVLGDAFYKVIATRLANNPNEANITKRVFKRIEFTVSAAGEDLSTYIGVNEPSNSIVSERPTFSNIEGGLGIFSSRTKLVISEASPGIPLKLNNLSQAELAGGQFTSLLKFEP